MELQHFSWDEFNCPGRPESGRRHMDEEFVTKLDIARDYADIPFIITSAYRTPDYNREIGGVRSSSHIKGLAVDIKAELSRNRYYILKSLLDRDFRRIGIGEDFIHVDDDSMKPQEVIWTYYD